MTPQHVGVYDSARRRRGVRRGRERGCWIYIPAVELQAAGIEHAERPYYRLWPSRKGRILVQLYREP